MEIVVGQQAAVDIAVAFLGARSVCLLFCDRICESCGGQDGDDRGGEIRLVVREASERELGRC